MDAVTIVKFQFQGRKIEVLKGDYYSLFLNDLAARKGITAEEAIRSLAALVRDEGTEIE